jgi:hypothetical protein
LNARSLGFVVRAPGPFKKIAAKVVPNDYFGVPGADPPILKALGKPLA